jgi:hypothetical protein
MPLGADLGLVWGNQLMQRLYNTDSRSASKIAQRCTCPPRWVFLSRRLMRSGRVDLIDAAQRGAMSLNRGLRITEGRGRAPRHCPHCGGGL